MKMQPISENLKNAIHQTWSSIAADCDFCEDNESCIEMCIDADRLLFYTNNTEADEELKRVFEQRGYSAVLKAISKQVSLL